MKPPEMSYGPAYHQDRGTAYPQSVFAATHRSDQLSVPAGVLCRPSSESSGYEVSPRTCSPSRPSVAESSRSGIEPRVEIDSISGAHKGEQHTGLRANQPSLMLSENPSPRTQQRSNGDDDESDDDNQDAVLMLFRLSLPVPIYSIIAALFTICALIISLLITPLRLCSFSPPKTSFPSQLCNLLSPALHIHERLVRKHPAAETDRSSSMQRIRSELEPEPELRLDSSACYSVPGLVGVLILSPLFSIAILLFAWTAAFFWVFAMVLGNPDGTERKDDGRAAVLGVCSWWRRWLGKARKV